MKLKKIIALLLSIVTIVTCGSVYAENVADAQAADTEEQYYSGEFNAFKQMAEYISQLYIDDSISKEEIMNQGISKLLENNDPLLVSLLKATLSSMDDYSEFYTAEEYKQFQNSINNTFYGIGVTMSDNGEGYIAISGFSAGSNAEKAGVQIGDRIYKVDGTDVSGWSVQNVRSKIIGEEGTSVSITFLRGDKEVEISILRAPVNAATVSAGIYENGVGYIKIETFGGQTAEEFSDMLDYMRGKSVDKIVLDLRDNGGGLVIPAIEIAQQIVPKGKIVDLKYRQSKNDITYTSNFTKKEFDFVVLVNENTASASEILASAMQDSGCAKLVGQKTFGKAVVQQTYPLANGSVFKLTTGQYITRNGNEINRVGLTPDKVVENYTEKIDTSKYTQFDFKTKISLGNSGDNVKAIKERLKVFGYYGGDVESDVYDEEIATAVMDFQRVNDLFSYGVLDVATQKRADEIFADVDVYYDNQMDTAYELITGIIK